MIIKDNQFPFLFSGKLGNLTARVVNGKQQFAKKRGPRKSKPSIRELEIRRNMAIATWFLKPIAPLLKKYDELDGKKGFHKAMSYTIRHAIQGQHPDQRVDFSQVILGEGSLVNPRTYHVESPAKGLLEFTWSLEVFRRNQSKNDRIFTVVYCEELLGVCYETSGAERREQQYLMEVSDFSGKQVEVYFGFASTNGLFVSTSIYAGSINVL
jgi:hypothetical protein